MVRRQDIDVTKLIDLDEADTPIHEIKRILDLHTVRIDELEIGHQSRRPEVESRRDQHRHQKASQAHIEDLANQLLARTMLDPVIVVVDPGDKTMRLVDGYHRLEAYKKCGSELVWAALVAGNAQTARRISIEANLKSRVLPVSKKEQMQQLWEVVCENHNDESGWQNGYGVTKLAKIFGMNPASRSTIYKMIDVKKGLDVTDGTHWHKVRNPREWDDPSIEQQVDRLVADAEEIAKKIRDYGQLKALLYAIEATFEGSEMDVDWMIEVLQSEGHSAEVAEEDF